MHTKLKARRAKGHPIRSLRRKWKPHRLTTNRSKKRRAIEVGQLEAWLTHGRGSFHFENLSSLRSVLTWFFKAFGLYAPGERRAMELEVREMRFAFPNLPEAFDGFRILHLSDLHIDGMADLSERIVDQIRPLTYDLCILTGDYRFESYGPCRTLKYPMATLLEGIRAPEGIIGVLGNHDFLEIAGLLEEMGVTMLINESFAVRRGGEEIRFLGLDDPHYYGCDDLDAALAGVPQDVFKTMVVHTPELYEEAEKAGMDLYLCGHTHGGQIRLPLVGPILLNSHSPRRMARGSWTWGKMQGYTSPGAGSSMVPVRFNCPPEIGLIELMHIPG